LAKSKQKNLNRNNCLAKLRGITSFPEVLNLSSSIACTHFGANQIGSAKGKRPNRLLTTRGKIKSA
jgi:hypothetical protein